MVDRGKELADVALQDPARAGMVAGYFAGISAELTHRLMRPLPQAAGVRVGNELFVEERVQLSIYGVMKQPVAYTRLVYVAGFWVTDAKVVVAAVLVRFVL